MDRQLAAQRAEAEALRRETEQLRQLAMRNLDPEEQAEMRTRQLQGELERERQARQAIELEQSRRTALEDMSRTYGVPIEKLIDAESPADAYERILKVRAESQRTLEQRLAQIEADIAAKNAAAAVTPVGIASLPSSSDAAFQQRYNEAVWGGSSAASDRVRREAESAGIKIDVMYPLKNRKRTS
jgi:membrane protein involved in colicin uptake